MQNWLKLLRIVEATDEFSGAVKLQKVAYILQSLGRVPGEQFRWHRFGPYSPSIASRLDELEDMGALSIERPETAGVAHSFRLTECGRSIIEVLGDEADAPIGELARELYEWSREELEVAASIDYLRRHGRTSDEAIEEVKSLKAGISADVIDTAKQKLQDFRDTVTAG